MKVLIVNGSPHLKGCTYTALMEAAGVLEKEGIEPTLLQLGTKPMQDCIACGKCVKTGYCVFKDDCVNEAIDLLKASDGIIVGSPVYYAGPSGRLCSFLDRIFYCPSQHVLPDDQHAPGFLPVLEPGARQHSGRGEAGY